MILRTPRKIRDAAAIRALALTVSRARGGTGEGSSRSIGLRRPQLLNPLWVAMALALASAALVGCPNSILRNATEAAFETATEPAPTPTAAP